MGAAGIIGDADGVHTKPTFTLALEAENVAVMLVHRWLATGLADDVGYAFRARLCRVLAASWNFAVITGMEDV